MAFLQEIVALGLLVLCMTAAVSSHSRHSRYTPPNVVRLTDAFSHVSIGQEYSTFFGGSNTKLLNNGSSANLALDKSSGSGLVSRNKYYYGFFSAAIKLPSGLSPGVVVAFYWATHGGKYPVNYKYAPFVVSFAEMEMTGCIFNQTAIVTSCSKANPSSLDPVDGPEFARLSKEQSVAMDWARRKLMFYSYCNDRSRFKAMPPECK
ncbi:hypothetical protein D5086_026176 [Populus alba]|uniref:Uncharacterized protein n=1 Tax=Populus alba TaxID=43335 RepID=A0ACC4B2Q7_POPAL